MRLPPRINENKNDVHKIEKGTYMLKGRNGEMKVRVLNNININEMDSHIITVKVLDGVNEGQKIEIDIRQVMLSRIK